MRFKVDENLLKSCRNFSATRAGMRRVAEDRVLVTFDRGFSNIRAYAPEAHPGFIVFRLRSQDKPHVLAVSARLIAALREQDLNGELWIVDETRIRIR